MFKQFNLNLVAPPSISGHTVTEVTPGGQQLFVQTLLPASATIAYVAVSNASITTLSGEEPTVGRVIIQDASNPVTTRFLHLLQGADASAPQDAAVYLASSSGSPFEGAAVRGVAVVFPVNVLSNNFASTTYTVPGGITNQYVAGLAPNAGYTVSQTRLAGSLQVTVTPGGSLISDRAGLLSFNLAGQTLSGAPRFTSAQWLGASLHLAGTGMANVAYDLLYRTNLTAAQWVVAGTIQADSNGNFQFVDPSPLPAHQGFYRVSWQVP